MAESIASPAWPHDLVAIAHARDLEVGAAAPRRRRRRRYDPEAVDAALGDAERSCAADVPNAWERVIATEPEPVADDLTRGLVTVGRAIAECTDLKVGFLREHSTRVAKLAATAAAALGSRQRRLDPSWQSRSRRRRSLLRQ